MTWRVIAFGGFPGDTVTCILGNDMLPPPAGHPFDDATRVSAGDSRWSGHTSPDYWAFVGPFGGATAATILRAIAEHPECAGDPLTLTVNF